MRKLAIAVAAAALFGTAVPASAQIYYEDGYRGGWGGPSYSYRGWWGGEPRAQVYVHRERPRYRVRRHYQQHYYAPQYYHRGWWGG